MTDGAANNRTTLMFEVWGGWNEDQDFGAPDEFLEDFNSLTEAIEAAKEYQKNPSRYAYVRDKETNKIIHTTMDHILGYN